jgi:undecaprenyl-diphosphatase
MYLLIVLCFIQGITELLPISSSAHLFVTSHIMGTGDLSRDTEVILHCGSLLALVIYFWRTLWNMLCDSLKTCATWYITPGFWMTLIVFLATLPAIGIGFIVKQYSTIPQTLISIGWVSIVMGSLLGICDYVCSSTHCKIKTYQALCIGIAQTCAFIPGASRLGSCLVAARALGIDRWTAFQFSLLLAIPTLLGAGVLTVHDITKDGRIDDAFSLWPYVLCVCIISLLVLSRIKRFIVTFSFLPFALYRVCFGIILLYYVYCVHVH